nr:hypothetical protein [Tanacetum cinerariifolium]
MAPLTFADTHNMIVFLTKSDESKGFDQIVDFLNVQYALMVNPPIYVLCIKQFWALVSIKKSNDVVRIGKGFLGVETHLFDTMLVQPQTIVEDEDDNEVPAAPTPPSPTPEPSPSLQEHIPSPPQALPTPLSSPLRE